MCETLGYFAKDEGQILWTGTEKHSDEYSV